MTYVLVVGPPGAGKSTAMAEVAARSPVVRVLPERHLSIPAGPTDQSTELALQVGYFGQYLENAYSAWLAGNQPVLQERGIHDAHGVFGGRRLARGEISIEQHARLGSLIDVADALRRPSHILLLVADAHQLLSRLALRDAEPGWTADDLDDLAMRYKSWISAVDWAQTATIATQGRSVCAVASDICRIGELPGDGSTATR